MIKATCLNCGRADTTSDRHSFIAHYPPARHKRARMGFVPTQIKNILAASLQRRDLQPLTFPIID
jgi:hypothetical protein